MLPFSSTSDVLLIINWVMGNCRYADIDGLNLGLNRTIVSNMKLFIQTVY